MLSRISDLLLMKLLRMWSDLIQDRFVTVNNLVQQCDAATQAHMVQTLNNQSILMNKVVLGYQDLGNSFAIFRRESEDRECALYSQLKSMTQMVEQLGHKQEEFVTHSEESLSSYRTSVDYTSSPLPRRSSKKIRFSNSYNSTSYYSKSVNCQRMLHLLL
jgi:hypothetical protein